MQSVRFDRKVVVVTGAGGGIGKEYALEFGKRGAFVVVNDLGSTRHGDGRSTSNADSVVLQIQQAGGRAVASYDSVVNGDKIIKTAIDNFGRIDVLVNNAGILRDKSFQNMTESDWDIIDRVHLKGAFMCTKAAWPYMKKQKYGRIIFTSSTSGIYGRFGQANYSSAKMGLIGFCNSLALEGAKDNIFCNAIIPTAGSRLTTDIMPPEIHAQFSPAYIAPLVVWLCHESCNESGCVYEAGAGWYGKLWWTRSRGLAFPKDSSVSAENIRDNWSKIVDMDDSQHFKNADESMAAILSVIDVAGASNQQTGSPQYSTNNGSTFSYTEKDAILYALAVGYTPKTLKFVYENDSGFSVFPEFVVVSGLAAAAGIALESAQSNLKIDVARVVHGEQYFEFFMPFPRAGTIRSEAKILDVLDKGSGAVILCKVDTYDQQNRKLCSAQYDLFAAGSGNFGGKRTSEYLKLTEPVPTRKPDLVVDDVTGENQAALYRLASLDFNPLHIDPEFASAIGFKSPILHGLCGFGFALRRILEHYGNNDVSKLKEAKGRFSASVVPGQTVVTEMWKDGNKIRYQCKVKETGQIAVSGGYVVLTGISPVAAGTIKLSTTTTQLQPVTASVLKSDQVFKTIKDRLAGQPGLAKRVNAIYLWIITKDGKEAARWTLDLKTGQGSISQGDPAVGTKPNCTLTLTDEDMVQLVAGKLNAQKAFMTGKLKLKGNVLLAQKLQTLFKETAAKL